MDSQQRPPAGWYPDPNGGPGQRWWDGNNWSTRPEGYPVPAQAPPPPKKQKHLLAAGLAILGLLVLFAVFAPDDIGTGAGDAPADTSDEPLDEPVSDTADKPEQRPGSPKVHKRIQGMRNCVKLQEMFDRMMDDHIGRNEVQGAWTHAYAMAADERMKALGC